MKKKFKATGTLHIASIGVHKIAIESTNKHIPKQTKEYPSKKLDELIDIRASTGRRNNRW